ncbi:MAG: hypothetical protein V3T65_00795 [Acidobacteriota bacterium]
MIPDSKFNNLYMQFGGQASVPLRIFSHILNCLVFLWFFNLLRSFSEEESGRVAGNYWRHEEIKCHNRV